MESKISPENDSDIDLEDLQYFMSLSVEKKLEFLEQLQKFLSETMPQENKDIWERLKQEGF